MLLSQLPGDDRRGDQLPVRMAQRRTRSHSVILEDDDGLKPAVPHQIIEAHLERAQKPFDLVHRLMSQEAVMLRRLHDDFVRSAAAHVAEKGSLLVPVVVLFDAEGRELVRNDSHAPARRVGR